MARQIVIEETTVDKLVDLICEKVVSNLELVLDRRSKQPILDKEYCTIKDVCSLLNVTRQTVHLWVKKGLLENIKLGSRSTRFKTSDVLELLKKSERKRL
ncbi:MAG: helix-turn-helix domain-containing protein [Saprospiraceae bacterium]|nr:helix-turn-helix domain-containing protein [Saprospiraceae bacterium]